jgi:hypothetical protein
MQTFLPYPDFKRSVEILDYRRLGKQRIEVKQLLVALTGVGGWKNHPAALMWRGHSKALAQYGVVCCEEWIRRGYRDTTLEKLLSYADPNAPPPDWFGGEDFHLRHQSNLLRKNLEFYRPIFGPDVPDNLPYIWPESSRSI